MKKNKTKISVVEESLFGVYVWITGEGKIITDDDGNYLSIQSIKEDQGRIEKLRLAAKECGITDGRPYFMSGMRKITDEEYEYQKQRLEWGLIPDELDIAAFKEEQEQLEKKKARGQNIYDEDF